MRRIRIELSPKTMLIAAGIVAGVWVFLQLWQILLVVACALMLVGALNPYAAWLERRGLKHGWATGALFFVLIAAGLAFVGVTVPKLATQISDFVQHFPEKQQAAAAQLERLHVRPLADSVRHANLEQAVSSGGTALLAIGQRTIEIVAYLASTVFLALYVMLDRDRLRGWLFAIFPRAEHVRLSRVLIGLERIVGGYVRGQVITSALMAAFTFVVLLVLRVPNALLLALVAGVADVLPYVGAILACGPAVVAALSSRGPNVALIVGVILAAYQEFESRIIIPRVYGRVLRLPAATVLLALLVGGKLLGILGAILALPFAAAIRMLVHELRVALPGEEGVDPSAIDKDRKAEREFERRAQGAPAVEAAAIAVEIAEKRVMKEPDPDAAAEEPIVGKH